MFINQQELIRRIAQKNGQDSELIETILDDSLYRV